MAENIAKICFERIVPPKYARITRQKAITENPANASPFEAATIGSKLWKPRSILHVTFLDGIPEVQKKVEWYAHQWSWYANITFLFEDDPNAQIRVSFKKEGSWSALGTDALVEEYFPRFEPTMNFGWLTPTSPENDFSSVVLHEFGHALGMIHEHQSPASGIQWNKQSVITALSGPPNYWDLQTIQFNFFECYNRTQTQFTKFDPESIMLYSFPKEWTLNGLEFTENHTFSQTDKDFIKRRYPK